MHRTQPCAGIESPVEYDVVRPPRRVVRAFRDPMVHVRKQIVMEVDVVLPGAEAWTGRCRRATRVRERARTYRMAGVWLIEHRPLRGN